MYARRPLDSCEGGNLPVLPGIPRRRGESKDSLMSRQGSDDRMVHMHSPTEGKPAALSRGPHKGGHAAAMRALCIGFLALLLAAVPMRGVKAAPYDVPANHWARSAVIHVLERGLMGTVDDNAFRGDQPVTRYDLAVILERLLQQPQQAGTPLEGADLAILRDLVESFRADLVAYYQSRDDLVGQIRITHETIDIYSDTLNLVLTRLDRLAEEQEEHEQRLEESIAAFTARLDELTAKVAELEAENARLAKRLAAFEQASFEQALSGENGQ